MFLAYQLRAPFVLRRDPLQLLEHASDTLLEIERAEMEAADASLAQRLHHLHREIDAIGLDCCIVMLGAERCQRKHPDKDCGREC